MINQTLEQLSVLGLQLAIVDGWGVILPAKFSTGQWIVADEEIQAIGRQYGGLFLLATDQNKTYKVDETGKLTALIPEAEPMTQMAASDSNTIELGGFTLTSALHEAISRAMDDRGMAFGLNQIIQTENGYDGQIIAMSHAQSQHCMRGYTARSTLSYRRSQYIWAPDLEEMNRNWSQGLTANDPSSTIELSYRSFDPRLGIERTTQWKRYTHQYRLIDDGIEIYHIAYTIGSEECAAPMAVER